MHRDRANNVERALALALDYILGRQGRDGSWIDWDLPPGQSSTWTTAFVGCKLIGLRSSLRSRASGSIHRASQWLKDRTFADNGWGYNDTVESDADSTALAILFLTSAEQSVREGSYACLQSFQCADGGFATFRGLPNLGYWAVSHADVTPSAVLAMMTKYGVESETVDRGLQFIVNRKTLAGIWHSFWWTSYLYSTETSLHLLRAGGRNLDLRATRKTLLGTRPRHPFESALLLSSFLCLPDVVEEEHIWPMVDRLLEDQQADGSWRSGPLLRVTRRDCLEPWKQGDPDQLFCDQNRLFTTATVTETLSKISLSW
ncbi:MAG: prenyltransferase/squalene oxidase repeat-containing protein [Acidobacteriaceae bacterium]